MVFHHAATTPPTEQQCCTLDRNTTGNLQQTLFDHSILSPSLLLAIQDGVLISFYCRCSPTPCSRTRRSLISNEEKPANRVAPCATARVSDELAAPALGAELRSQEKGSINVIRCTMLISALVLRHLSLDTSVQQCRHEVSNTTWLPKWRTGQ